MEKKTYTKPFLVVEEFVPQEFVAACWYINNTCWNFLSHDDPIIGVYDQFYNETALAENHGLHRVPSESNKYFNDNDNAGKWNIIANDGHYYAGHNNGILGAFRRYTDQLANTVTIYHIKYDGKDHYFSAPTYATGKDANKSG